MEHSDHTVDLPRTTQWYRQRGRLSQKDKSAKQQYLTPREEKALSAYVLRMARCGQPLPVKSLRALAQSVRRQRSTTFQLPCLDEVAAPGKNWPQGFYKRHPELKARRTKAIDRNRHDECVYEKTVEWFNVVRQELERDDVLAENVYNMDETGVMLSVLGSLKVVVDRNDHRPARPAHVQRTLITAIECISADGRHLEPLIIWPASTHRSAWTAFPTPGWHFACSKSGYTDTAISLYWVQHVFDPLTQARAQGRPRLLISDGFGTHESLEVLKFCFQNNIILCRLPSHTSHKLQPCDIGVFGPLKAAYREQAERLYRGGANKIGKQHFTLLYSKARQAALTARNIRSSWAKAGLFPFNPERVLNSMTPPVRLSPPNGITTTAQEAAITLTPPLSATSIMSLRTPTTAAGFEHLRRVFEKTSDALDARSKACFEKLCHAAENAYTDRSLLFDDNRLLFEQNNEKLVRETAKSTVVGKAKVMSYDDILAAQRKRDSKRAQGVARRQTAAVQPFQVPIAQMLSPVAEEMVSSRQEIVSMGLAGSCHILDSRC